jgi:hypothetical protein
VRGLFYNVTQTPTTIPSVSTKTGHLPSPANSQNAWSGRGLVDRRDTA